MRFGFVIHYWIGSGANLRTTAPVTKHSSLIQKKMNGEPESPLQCVKRLEAEYRLNGYSTQVTHAAATYSP